MSKQAFKRVRRHLGVEVSREPLPAFAWPGGSPIFYLCADGGCLCPTCANAEIAQIDNAIHRDRWDTQWRVDAADVNYEDTDLYCDYCNKPIDAAYAD